MNKGAGWGTERVTWTASRLKAINTVISYLLAAPVNALHM